MEYLTDLNAPDNDKICPKHLRLWRRVLIQAIKDATESRLSARMAYYGWVKEKKDFKLTCEFAGMDHETVHKIFKEISESEDKRLKYKDDICETGKRPKKCRNQFTNERAVDLFNYSDLLCH